MSENKKVWAHSQHPILDGEAVIFRVPPSGDVWQFRMYLRSENKHYRKSLRTRDLDSALSKGRSLALDLLSKVESGKKLFGIPLSELITQYLAFRQREADSGIITQGRHVTLTSQLNHLIRLKGGDLKVSELDKGSIFEYRLLRKEYSSTVKDVTIRNEQATINALCRWAYREGFVHFEKFDFEILRISKDQIGVRDTFTFEEYDRLVRHLRSYTARKNCKSLLELVERKLIQDYILIASNSGLRVGEQRQLTWRDVGRVEHVADDEGFNIALVNIKVRAETSKVRSGRNIITRGGEYFERLRSRVENFDIDDFVFTSVNSKSSLPARSWERHWRNLMFAIGIGDYKDRNLTWYSLRHFCITCRVKAGVNIIDIAKVAGTSVTHIENTYLKYNDEMMVNAALKSIRLGRDGSVWVKE